MFSGGDSVANCMVQCGNCWCGLSGGRTSGWRANTSHCLTVVAMPLRPPVWRQGIQALRRRGRHWIWRQTVKPPSLGFHRVCSLIGRPANLLSAAECGRGSGRKEPGDESRRTKRNREEWKICWRGWNKSKWDTQEAQFKIHNWKDPVIYSRWGTLPILSLNPRSLCWPWACWSSDVAPTLVTQKSQLVGCASQAASGWCVQWKALVGLKGKGKGEARETLTFASASGGCSDAAARQDLRDPTSWGDPELPSSPHLVFHPGVVSGFLPLSSLFICGNNSLH